MHLTEQEAEKMGFDPLAGRKVYSRPPAGPKKPYSADRTKAWLEAERQGTTELVNQLRLIGVPEPRSMLHPDGQLKFHPQRKWRFDLAWDSCKLAVELQGFGTHSSVKGLSLDTEKACEAAVLGWTVLPMLYKDVKTGRACRWIELVFLRLTLGRTTK